MTIDVFNVQPGDKVRIRYQNLTSDWLDVFANPNNEFPQVQFHEDISPVYLWNRDYDGFRYRTPRLEVIEHEPKLRTVTVELPNYPAGFDNKVSAGHNSGEQVYVGISKSSYPSEGDVYFSLSQRSGWWLKEDARNIAIGILSITEDE